MSKSRLHVPVDVMLEHQKELFNTVMEWLKIDPMRNHINLGKRTTILEEDGYWQFYRCAGYGGEIRWIIEGENDAETPWIMGHNSDIVFIEEFDKKLKELVIQRGEGKFYYRLYKTKTS